MSKFPRPLTGRLLLTAQLLCCWTFTHSSTASAEEQAPLTTVIALGTQGGPQPNPHRSQPAHAVQVNGETYLIDAGNGVARQLTAVGIAADTVKRVFITHNHDDHNADLGTLMGLSWSLHNRDDYEVFGPAGTRDVVDGFMQYYAVNAAIRDEDSPLPRFGSFAGDVEVHNIGDADTAKVIFKDGNVEVSAIENCHYHHGDPVSTDGGIEKSYAYRFESRDRSVVFSGDTGPCPQLVDFARGADILVHEVFNTDLMAENLRANGMMAALPDALLKAMLRKSEQYHTTPVEVGKLARAAGVGMVLLTHVMPGRGGDPDEAYSAGVLEQYPGKVIVARDLERY